MLLPAVALMLTACASQPRPGQTTIPVEAAQRTLAVGFQQLSERYIDYMPVSLLAYEGLRGLNAIDPDFVAIRDGNTVWFGIGNPHHHSLKAPDDIDADGWAALTVEAVRVSQADSPDIAQVSAERIYEAVFDGSLSLLDTFSRYAGAEEATRNREKRSGFGGIGVVAESAPGGVSVVRVFADSPANRAGLSEGDLITHVDHQPIDHLTDPTDVARGPIGSSVLLRVEKADGAVVELDVKRQRVIAPTVEMSVANNIITAKVSGFTRATPREVSNGINDAVARLDGRARGIVLDLRGNPGGLLSEAVRVADLFISSGRILTTKGRHPASLHDYDAREDDIVPGLPIVVLINGRSASASEIVAAALQDHDRAVVVGSSSYGKGTVQMVIALPNEGELTITWSRFVTPAGYILNGLGVHPSICTSMADANAEQMIRKALDTGSDLTRVLEMWRDIDRHPEMDRKGLKALCPASDAIADMDGVVADAVIADLGLYQRILAFAPTVVAAHE